jgi:hypothetical protein
MEILYFTLLKTEVMAKTKTLPSNSVRIVQRNESTVWFPSTYIPTQAALRDPKIFILRISSLKQIQLLLNAGTGSGCPPTNAVQLHQTRRTSPAPIVGENPLHAPHYEQPHGFKGIGDLFNIHSDATCRKVDGIWRELRKIVFEDPLRTGSCCSD